MPDYHKNILCVRPTEFEALGIKASTIYRYVSGQDKGELYCWENHKQGKHTYIHYHSLKTKYKALIKAVLCEGLEPEIWIKNRDQQKAQASIESLTDQLTGLVQSDLDEIKTLTETKRYTNIEVHQLARAAGWLRLINEYDVKKVRKLGFKSIADFRTEVFKRCLNEQTAKPNPLIKFKKGLITSEQWLYRNALDYKREGINALIHKGVGNVNREKTDALMHAKLITLASEPVKYSFEDIAMMFNDWAIEQGKEQLTTSAIKKYLAIPKVKKVWYYNRHGKLAADNELQSLINRDIPSFPDALWSIDGTTMQLYYRDLIEVRNKKTGKLEKKIVIKSDLYVYFITDAHTGAIIGYSVAFAETAAMVDAALRNAVATHENKPYQVQYDNSSANIAVAVQNLISNMSRVHFPCEPYKGRSKYVESIIGHFQQRELRKLKNFKGGNITTTSLNSKANPELLATLRKNSELLPDRSGVLAEFDIAVGEWNSRGEKRDNYGRFIGKSKIERYTTIEHEKREKLNYFDRISMFMVEQRMDYTYGVNGIEIEVNGNKHHFAVPDPDTAGDFMFANDNLGQKFMIKMDRENPDMIALYKRNASKEPVFVDFAYNKERYAACVADMKKGQNAKRILLKQKQDEWGQQYATRELEKQMLLLDDIKSNGTDGFGWWDSSKTNNNITEGAQEDTANGMSDGLTARQRKILNIGK